MKVSKLDLVLMGIFILILPFAMVATLFVLFTDYFDLIHWVFLYSEVGSTIFCIVSSVIALLWLVMVIIQLFISIVKDVKDYRKRKKSN